MNKAIFRITVVTVLVSYALVFFEWLFHITKPSFFSNQSVLEKIVTLLIAPLPLALCSIAVIVLLWLIFPKKYQGIVVIISTAVPVLVLVGMELLLIDNFTYVVFHFNVASFSNFWRYIYCFFLVLLFGWNYTVIKQKITHSESKGFWAIVSSLATCVFICSVVLTLVNAESPVQAASEKYEKQESVLPNIIILSTDGVDADRMSAYGYELETTPFIDTLLSESLIFENCFANAGHTTGSIVSMLTGKLPTETRVLYPPDTLSGIDMYQHLPNILHDLGYYNGEISLRFYADSIDLNMHDSFDYANFRNVTNPLNIPRKIRLAYASEIYFLERVIGRVSSRVLHVMGITDMVDYYSIVTVDPENKHVSDSRRYFEMIRFINKYPQPFFMNVHMLNTHGPLFHTNDPYFSKGTKQKNHWMKVFVDDAMREFDNNVRKFITFLKERDLYDNTMIILSADHGMKWQNRVRVPLIIKFPFSKLVGKKEWNVQRLDIAPTLLNYLGVAPPVWMEGSDVLSHEPDLLRPIITTRIKTEKTKNKEGKLIQGDVTPPFYTLGFVDLIRCNRWVSLNLEDGSIHTNTIPGHTRPCVDDELPALEEEKKIIINHLDKKGYDVSSLQH